MRAAYDGGRMVYNIFYGFKAVLFVSEIQFHYPIATETVAYELSNRLASKFFVNLIYYFAKM